MTHEFFELAGFRLAEMQKEDEVREPFGRYFKRVAFFLSSLMRIYKELETGESEKYSLTDWQETNELLYADILPGFYDESFANPAYAVSVLGGDYGQFLSFVYSLCRGAIPAVFDQNADTLIRRVQYFLSLYGSFVTAASDDKAAPDMGSLKQDLYDFMFYSYEDECMDHVRNAVVPRDDLALGLVMRADHKDISYLYRYGEYISQNQVKMAEYISGLSNAEIRQMADTFTEGYRIGFEKTGKDLSKKTGVDIMYPLGLEPVIRIAVENFEKMGLKPVIRRNNTDVYFFRYGSSAGYFGEEPNRQYSYDHREDIALFWDKNMAKRRLDCLENAYKHFRDHAAGMAGPAATEIFGLAPFIPEDKDEALTFTKKQRELSVWYYSMQSEIVNRFIPGEERSYTIISYPVPEIGDDYEEIMSETIRINTLDWRKYEKIQQTIIDALDGCSYARVRGRLGNTTDLTVKLIELTDRNAQTKFENCVADVNIPVGEVFTTPVLNGTNGELHVKRVFLYGNEYRDLRLCFKEGMVSDYSCANFDDPQKGRKLVESQIMHHHDTLPMGEFAIGTNTAAYVMGRKYDIEDRMDILIAEKTGPHIAVGDTCYSYAEDIRVYNPDGKEIIARDNELTLNRKSEDDNIRQKAYFQCHTDITIPYDELGGLWGVREDGSEVMIIKDGRFVLPGTEQLNSVLD